MSASNSNLSSSKYGYDFVVATTQASINATMDEYLSGISSPEVIMCYIIDDNGNPQEIAYDDLLKQTNGTDPFNVPDQTPTSDQRIKNLSNAWFMYAFKASIGLPPGYAPLTPSGSALPNIVTLGANTASVTFSLMCSEFQVVEANYGPKGIVSYLNKSQPDGNAWMFTSQVDLRLTSDAAYGNLPPAVQAQIKNLGGNAFSIQQLLFDLDNAALESIPTISGVAPGTPLYNCLQSVFLGAYFNKLQANGQPVLSYSITQSTAPASTLTLTDLNMEVNPFMGTNGQPVSQPTTDQQNLSTLCYLCAANGTVLPAAAQFSWNWIDPSESSNSNGIVSINRNTFANYFKDQLLQYVPNNCYKSSVHVELDGLDVKFSFSLSPGQAPNVTIPSTGSTVLTMSYSSEASDQAGLGGDMGRMELNPSMNVTVQFTGNTIVIVQHLVIYLYVRGTFGVHNSGNVVDKTITDTYTISVDSNGDLTAAYTSNTVDNSVTPSTDWFSNFWGSDVNALTKSIAQWAQNFASRQFTDIPLSTVRNFVFPGGNTFTYNNVVFSDNQDLVSHIVYIQPS
ncbi:hypothetical protein [Paludibacter sp.]|uniref:hypothetical protein n=1 Tax=Paludibacter sp. TaxID=1898105 RepID=UPI001353BFE6|nr:hypothetical protein [Paludibacter sp.]MTK52213.1 hypothetical protein [Paludibacter sp.]